MTKELDDLMLKEDLIDILCGSLIGKGCFRNVFECNLLENCVVKIEHNSTSWSNAMEYQIWDRVMYTEHSKWFAQVKWISSNGRILIMERTYRPGLHEWPDKIPAYLTDIKPENFGMSMLTDPKTGEPVNRFVAHDYASHLLWENGMTKRMKKVDWNAK